MKFNSRIKFTHIENDGIKKTKGSVILRLFSFPSELRLYVPYVFPEYNRHYKILLSAETVCEPGDSYDKEIGKDIVRYKIEKKYYSMVKMLCDAKLKELHKTIDSINSIRENAIEKKNNKIEILNSYGDSNE